MESIIASLIPVFLNQGIDIFKKKVMDSIEKNKSLAIQKSLSELLDLVRIVDDRLKKVESTHDKVFQSPDYYHLISKSFQSVSNFPNKYKTTLMGELIIKRFFNSSSDDENLLISIAAEKLEYLNIKHLKILAAMYSLGFNNLYDLHIHELGLKDLTPEKVDEKLSYLKREKLSVSDFKYMGAIGVIDILTPRKDTGREFTDVIFFNPTALSSVNQKFKYEVKETEIGRILSDKSLKIGNMLLNPFGVYIGREASLIFEKVK